MTRRDPGAANSAPIREPGRCSCSHLEPLHRPGVRAGRTRCEYANCLCTRYSERPARHVITFPGAGVTPAPAGPRTAPADLDAMGERYVAYCEARDSGREREADLLARAVADDVPALREEIHRVELLRRELAAELDRVTGHA